jgi:hypothetical protein
VLLACAGIAQAADCTVADPVPTEAALQGLLQRLPECQRDANYLAAIGHLLNERGRYLEAADHLERALLLAPELKGAQVDYAIALAGGGDLPSALGLVDNLLGEPDLPGALRPVLARLRVGWTRHHGPQWRAVLNARVGYDSNLLGSPNLSTLTLTFPGQSVELPLDDSYQRRAGAYGRLDAQVEARGEVGEHGQWDAYLGLRSRRSDSVSQAGSDQADAALQYNNYQRAPTGSGIYAGAAVSYLHARTGIEYRAQALTLGLGSTSVPRGCDAKLGVDLQNRDYLNNPVLSGRYSGISLIFACEASSRLQWFTALKAGVERASDAARPGGDQDQLSVRAGAVWNFANRAGQPGDQLLLDIEVAQSKDRTSYSPLLESGRLRDVRRSTARAEYQYTVRPGLQLVAGAEWTVQRATLPLFGSRSWGPYAVVRWTR